MTLTLTAADATSGVALTEYRVNGASAFGAVGAARFAPAEWITYNPAAKPVFTADGAYSIEYRSTDNAGNVEAIKTVAFTIGTPTGDTTAPVTTATLDPAQPGPGRTYPGPVGVRLSALDPSGGQERRRRRQRHAVDARGRQPQRRRQHHVALRRDRGQRP